MKPVKGSFANLFPKLRQEFTLPRIRTVMMLEDSGLAPWVGIHDEAQPIVMESQYIGSYPKINCFRQSVLL